MKLGSLNFAFIQLASSFSIVVLPTETKITFCFTNFQRILEHRYRGNKKFTVSDFLFIELYSLRLTFAIEIEVVPRENKDGQYPIYVDIPSENESAFKK